MTQVTFAFSDPSDSGADVPATGYIECSLVVTENDSAGTRTIERFAVDLVSGAAVAICSPTSVGQAWRFGFHGVAGMDVLFKAVPDQVAPIRYDLLADIDPESLIVSVSGLAAWTAAVTTVQALIDGGSMSAAVDPGNSRVLVLSLIVPDVAPVMTAAPYPATASAGQVATFTSYAIGTPTPAVQWQMFSAGVWANIAGATSTSYSTAATIEADTGKQFRAVFTNSAGTVTSSAALLTVSVVPVAPAIVTDWAGGATLDGVPTTITATASGVPAPSVQWQTTTDGTTFSDIAGATSTSYTTPANPVGMLVTYRARFTNSAGTVLSQSASVVINSPILITGQPTNKTVANGASVAFAVTITGSITGGVRGWQVSTDGGSTWADVGVTFNTYTHNATSSENGNRYRWRGSNAAPNSLVYSNVVILTVT